MIIFRWIGYCVAFLILLCLLSISALAVLLSKAGKRLDAWADRRLWEWGL